MAGSPPLATGASHLVSVPIKVRLVGRPTDADLDRLSETVSRAVAWRLALAHRTLSTTAALHKTARHPKARPHDVGPLALIQEHPVVEGPLETEPTGIEGATVESRLLQFLDVVEEEINAWRTYRQTFAAPIPGAAAYLEALSIEPYLKEVYRTTTPPPTFDPGTGGRQFLLGPPSDPYDPRVRHYLARKLGPEKLSMLREMVRFGRTPIAPATGSVPLGSLFGLDPTPLLHEYKCIVTVDRGAMAGLYLGLGGFIRHIKIEYHNDMGMTYTKEISAGSVALWGGGGAEVGWKMGRGIRFSPGKEREPDKEREASVYHVAEGETSTKVFWEPEDFAGNAFTVEKISGELVGGIGPLTGGVEGRGLELITFYHSVHGHMAFNLVAKVLEPSAAKIRNWFEWEFTVGSKAGIEVQAGATWSIGEAEVAAPKAAPPQREETGEWRALLEGQVFFPTGGADISDDATRTIADLVRRTHVFKAEHPDYKLRFVVTGHASPRWAHPTGSRMPNELNTALSARRAANALEQIRNVFRNIGSGPTIFEKQSQPGPEISVDDLTRDAIVRAEGPLEALAEHRDPDDDWWQDRRVDMIVYRNEFGIATEKPPELGGTFRE